MKSRLAAALSLTGVLVAGSAAAFVNTQVLDSNDNSASAAAAPVLPAATSLPVTSVVTPTTPSSTALPQGETADLEAGRTTQATYAIGAAGTVTLDTADDRLSVVSAVPNGGWQVVTAENDGPLNVTIVLRSPTVEVTFRANLLYGVIGTSVESTDLTAPAPVGGSSSGGDDDHDDEDGEYEDHDDDEDHEDEDHEDEYEEEGDDD